SAGGHRAQRVRGGGRRNPRAGLVVGLVVTASRWIPSHRREEFRTLASRSREVVVMAAIAGALTGVVVALLERVVVDVLLRHVLELQPWMLAVVPSAGLVASYVIRRYGGPRASSASADEYLRAFHDREHVLARRPYPVRMLAAVATLGSGCPMGLE